MASGVKPTISLDKDGFTEMLRKLQISDGKLVETTNGQGIVSVYIAPDESERKYLVEQLKIDEHTLNSSLDPDELSRLEFEPDHIAVIFKRPKRYSEKNNFLFKVASTGVFLFKDRLVIVITEDVPLFEGKQFAKIQSVQDILLKLIHRVIAHFVEHLRGIDMISSELEHQINVSMENKHLLNLFALEKSLVYYLSATNANAVVIEKLKNNAAKIGFSQENIEFLDDILIENNQCRGQTEIYSQVLASLMDARASIISNNLNIRMKTLTLVMILIMVPTLVVSLFSMNVRIPISGHAHAFWIITAMAVICSAVIAFLWRHRGW
ncbi:MAG: magnesium transporter CorA family protein [Planctomycetota bacterium]|nr:magnesium transporter CorA family protein [Planctomycetota bacterium]